ncbi:phage tail tube protein [Candidatus Magnetomonas plexicatena]|uniref:phage tail tube protein n=1 Tax=Candidatus Magnetomonas plexicatena TaxID=2552947 RepID=UPI001101D8AE|nr:hypothetical protein E2O03_005830 [Nitrospirales bacterium LBB_01]
MGDSLKSYVQGAFIGSGNLYIDILDNTTGAKTGEILLGNVTEFKLTVPKITKVDMKSKTRGSYGNVIKSVITGYKQSLEFTLSDYTKETLRLAFLGDNENLVQLSGSVTNEEITAYMGKYTKLAYRNVKSTPMDAVVTAATDPSVTYVAGTDYEVDYETGRIYTIEEGGIGDAQKLKVDYSYDALTASITSISTNKRIEAFVRFIGLDRVNRRSCELELLKASITPVSEIDLISNKFTELKFSGEVLTTDDGTGRFLFKD